MEPPGPLVGSSVPGGDNLVPSPSWPGLRRKSEAMCVTVPSGCPPSSREDPGDTVVAGSPSRSKCQVPQGLVGSRQLRWAWGHLPSPGQPWLWVPGVAFACFGTFTRSSHAPVVPRPCLVSLCRAFNFASMSGGGIS